jgi:hypothetical protein
MPAPITLDPPPAYLAEVPHPALLATAVSPAWEDNAADRLLGALRRRGIYARPSLAEVEAERTRRGLRRGVFLGDGPAPSRVVLPLLGATREEEIRAQARANRARIDEALAS